MATEIGAPQEKDPSCSAALDDARAFARIERTRRSASLLSSLLKNSADSSEGRECIRWVMSFSQAVEEEGPPAAAPRASMLTSIGS